MPAHRDSSMHFQARGTQPEGMRNRGLREVFPAELFEESSRLIGADLRPQEDGTSAPALTVALDIFGIRHPAGEAATTTQIMRARPVGIRHTCFRAVKKMPCTRTSVSLIWTPGK